jgi:hypothetical protein
MEKRSRRRIRDLVALAAFQGLSENEIGCARISMMARSKRAPFKGRIQKRKTNRLQIVISGLHRTAYAVQQIWRRFCPSSAGTSSVVDKAKIGRTLLAKPDQMHWGEFIRNSDADFAILWNCTGMEWPFRTRRWPSPRKFRRQRPCL